MADNNSNNNSNDFATTVGALFKGMDSFITTKTVVGEAIQVDSETTILPLVDVSFGVGAGAYADDEKKKNNGGGGMGGKITPSSVLIIKNGVAKVVPVREQDALSKVIDYVPEIVNKFKNKNNDNDKTDDTNFDDEF